MKPDRSLRRARGFSMLELSVALMLILVAICIAGSALAQATLHERMLQKRMAAREAVMIGLERLRAQDRAALPKAGETVDVPLPPGSAQRLPHATARLTASAVESAPALLRLRMEVNIPGSRDVERGEVILSLPNAKVQP